MSDLKRKHHDFLVSARSTNLKHIFELSRLRDAEGASEISYTDRPRYPLSLDAVIELRFCFEDNLEKRNGQQLAWTAIEVRKFLENNIDKPAAFDMFKDKRLYHQVLRVFQTPWCSTEPSIIETCVEILMAYSLGNKETTKSLFDDGYLVLFKQFFDSAYEDRCNLLIWTLGNILQDDRSVVQFVHMEKIDRAIASFYEKLGSLHMPATKACMKFFRFMVESTLWSDNDVSLSETCSGRKRKETNSRAQK